MTYARVQCYDLLLVLSLFILFYLPSIFYNIPDHQFVFSRGRHISGQDKQTSLITIDMLKCIYHEDVGKEDLSFILMLVKDKELKKNPQELHILKKKVRHESLHYEVYLSPRKKIDQTMLRKRASF